MNRLVLASGSRIRAQILENAGIPFRVVKPDIDETRIIEQRSSEGLSLPHIAEELAVKKAQAAYEIEAISDDEIVLGSDQILEFNNRPYEKPASFDEAKRRLLEMAGKSHRLINGTALCQSGNPIWIHHEQVVLTLRNFSNTELEIYMKECSPTVLSSVGAYQIEKLGIRLFSAIEGSHFTVLGLALLALLPKFREYGITPY